MTVPAVATRRVQDYLADLEDALAHLPRQRRREIVHDVRSHVEAALADAGNASPATVDEVLRRLGPPSEIAAAADEYNVSEHGALRTRDLVTVLTLLAGGVFVPIIGWFIGVALLWTSPAWARRDKVIGTLLVPGGLLAAVVLGVLPTGSGTIGCAGPAVPAGQVVSGVAARCTTATASGALPASLHITILIVTAAVPVCTAWWLAKQARRSR